ncbi:SRG-62 protein [Aphelenchoides avenae]|nr:SRG-62 protein [Aphelenchus avenae]
MDNVENIKVLTALVYALPSFIMSSIIVLTIVGSLKASFYRLYAVAATTDMLLWLFVFVTHRARNAPIFFPAYALLPKEGPALTGILFMTYYFVYIQYGTTLSLTLNRFSVIVLPFVYVKLWKKYFYVIVAVIFVYPIPLTYHIVLAGGFLGWNNPNNTADGYRLDIKEDGTEKRNSIFMMTCSATLGVLLVAMNLAVATSLYRRRRQNMAGRVDKEDTRDTESKLFLLTCIMFSFSAITFVMQCLFYFLFPARMSLETFLLLFDIQNWAIDLHTCTSPWFLILMSRAVREEVVKTVPLLGKLYCWPRFL